MGGMFTVLKVREQLHEGHDPGWYAPPEGTLAQTADPDQMRRDLGDAAPKTPAPAPSAPPSGGHQGHGGR